MKFDDSISWVNLSSGEEKTLILLNALLSQKSIILLDEIFSGIDYVKIEKALSTLKEASKITIVIYVKDFNKKFLIRDNPKKDFEENNYDKILNKIVVGKINVIIGPNGSGKTHILKNIFNNMQNAVLLPDHMTLLSQSIYENITLGDENSLFEQSVSIAQLYPSEFEEGFEQQIEYSVSNISGGQLFRIALTRTLKVAR